MRAVSRITLSPIVETLPCVGGVSITLLEAPHFDAAFSLLGPFDLLSLPFIHEAFQYAVKVRNSRADTALACSGCCLQGIKGLLTGH